MNTKIEMQIRARAVDTYEWHGKRYAHRGGKKQPFTPWRKNLVLDQALNAFANISTGAGASSMSQSFVECSVGSSASPNKIPSSSITFTQLASTVTASSTFFTAAMVGGILKYGTGSGGAEQYIISQTGTAAVVSSSATVASPTVGTVWLVQQTSLVAPLYTSSTYQTSGSSCGTIYVSNAIVFQRTFNFALQGSPYSVNEIGWGFSSATLGRIVLPSTIVVGVTQFLQVQLQLTASILPSTPTPVGNVGVGLDTSGNLMAECFPFSIVLSNGTVNGFEAFDPASSNACFIQTVAPITQNSSLNPSPTGVILSNALVSGNSNWVWSSIGFCTRSYLATIFTTSGQTLYGIGMRGGNADSVLDIVLTNPVTLPTGSYQPQLVFFARYTRALVN